MKMVRDHWILAVFHPTSQEILLMEQLWGKKGIKDDHKDFGLNSSGNVIGIC